MILDVRTLMALNILINVINAATMFSVWIFGRKRYPGILAWFVNMVFQAIGSVLILLRGNIPDFFSIVLANALLLAGGAAIYKGLGQYAGKRVYNYINTAVLVIFMALSTYYTYWSPNLAARLVLISVAGILIHLQVFLLVFFRIDKVLYRESLTVGAIFLLYIAASMVRAVYYCFWPETGPDFFNSGNFNAFSILFYLTINVCLNISLALMVNRRLIREIRIQEEKFAVAFHSSPYAILITRPSDGYILEVNEGFRTITGHDPAEIIGKTTLDIQFWDDPPDRDAVIAKVKRGENGESFEYQFRKKSGQVFTGLFATRIIHINNKEYILSTISDITEFNRMKMQLEDMATHDFLTGLPNRMFFFSTFQSAIPEALKKQKTLAVFSLDLDNFKIVNDQYGHSAGDGVLIEIGRRLKSLVTEQHIAARLGGDEFILLQKDVEDIASVSEFAEKILGAMIKPFEVGKYNFHLTISIGIALCPQNATDMEALIFKSDEAMYYVKAHGKNAFRFFDEISREKDGGEEPA